MTEWHKTLMGAGAGLALYLLWQVVDEIRSTNAKLQYELKSKLVYGGVEAGS